MGGSAGSFPEQRLLIEPAKFIIPGFIAQGTRSQTSRGHDSGWEAIIKSILKREQTNMERDGKTSSKCCKSDLNQI